MVTKELIKELRVKIDGLSQLVKSINTQYRVDINLKHREESLENFTTRVKETGFGTKHLISNELKESYKSLILAKAWLGKVLEELGDENPYKSGYKTVADIEPTADKCEVLCTTGLEGIATNQTWKEINHIQKVDWLRTEIQHITYIVYQTYVTNSKEDIINFTWEALEKDSKIRFHSEPCYRHLCEARIWLDFELQRIKEQSDERNTNNTSNN
jgi:hypothetical protein